MSSPRSSSSSPSSTPLTITSASLSSSMTNAPTRSATPPQTGLSASSSEPTVVAPEAFDIDKIMDKFPQAELVDYHETQRGQVVSPSSSKALVLYKPKAPRLENLQERLEEVVRDLVLGAAKELNDLADAEINKEHKQEEASHSTKEEGELMIATPQQAPTHHESPKRSETNPAVTRRQAQSATKQVAHIANVSFEIPDEVKVDDDTINKLVPMDEALRHITAQSGKNYSFYDRLHGWKMECRIRLNSWRQYDKYYTHLQSKTVTRSVPEAVRFILYEVTPQQMREAKKKRKMETPDETSSQNVLIDEDLNMSPEDIAAVLEVDGETYVEMWYRIAWTNLINSTAVKTPSEAKWEELKAAKQKTAKQTAETTRSKPGDCTPTLDVEAANALIGLAAEESSGIKRPKTSN